MLDAIDEASSLPTGPFCMRTYGTPSAAAADVRVLVLNGGPVTSSVAKWIFCKGTGGTPLASAHDTNLGLTLSPPAHHSQKRFQYLQGAACQQGLGVIEFPRQHCSSVHIHEGAVL